MSEPSLLPPSASDFMRCVERGATRLSALPVSLNQLWDPDTCPVALLPYLAWALSVDRWDRDWTEETKRQVIRDAWAIHRHKGTISAIRRVVEPFGYVINVTEWWETGDPRGTFRLDIGVLDTGISAATYTELERLIDDARPVSRHLTGLNIVQDIYGDVYAGGAVFCGDTIRGLSGRGCLNMKYGAIITAAGAARLAAATTATGQKLNITHMAVGDGNGNLPEPSASQTALNNEVWRGTLNKITQNSKAPNQVIAELVIPPEVGGFWMRELGLYDDSGTLIAVANMAESYKPLLAEGSGRSMVCRMFIIISDMNAVNLSVDSSVIAATQEYVNEAISGLHRAIIDDVVLQHKVVDYIDYVGIFDGADNMSQGFCICDTPQGTECFCISLYRVA